ncbi:alpha/beta-hydrolase [Podospora australis]|uniref:Carboxylic ester hydrolase n=1 Tax=Podospora australis TaxID=1536484 RepID=A0AAN6WID1_9PEZI|nr:alpha/beta-hydrolase [Podospora australis]
MSPFLLLCLTPTLTLTAAAVPTGSLPKISADIYNPTNITFYLYQPARLTPNPPILVSPHWCHGSALAVYNGSSYAKLAEQYGFLVIFPDSPNTDDHCWDVSSRATLSHYPATEPGDTLGIVNMVHWTIKQYAADAGRVFVSGVSSGAMMTEVLLGAYPDVFAAGTAFAGVPFGCFASPENDKTRRGYWNDDCARGKITKSPAEWKAVVEGAYPGYRGWRPKLQIFHGTEDDVLFYPNFEESIKQWTAVLGLNGDASWTTVAKTDDTPFANWTKYAYSAVGHGDETWFEAYSAKGVNHNIGNHEEIAVKFFELDCVSGNGEGRECFRWGNGGPLGNSLKGTEEGACLEVAEFRLNSCFKMRNHVVDSRR